MKQIVCLATSPWYPIPTRKQQVMSRMPDAEILYFDPTSGAATLDAKISACRRMETTTCIFFIIPMISFSSAGAESIGHSNGSSRATSRLGGRSLPGSSAKKMGVKP